jgi:hypothetical protein
MGVAVRLPLALGLALVLMTGLASAQNHDQPATGSFRVRWEPRMDGPAGRIQGHVYNDSPLRVTDVRLRVEGLSADDHPVGKTFAWALGDIVPGGETTFVVDGMPGAIGSASSHTTSYHRPKLRSHARATSLARRR